jgi:hypothetical protein
MHKVIVAAGQTYTLSRNTTFAGSAEIAGGAVPGGPGGYAIVGTGVTLTNHGSIQIDRGPYVSVSSFDPGLPGTLTVKGTLHNASVIYLQGGGADSATLNGGSGAGLYNTGVLTNTGLITIGGTPGSPLGQKINAATAGLGNEGTLTNTGTILLERGIDTATTQSGHGGGLGGFGVLTNDSTIMAQGGVNYSYGGDLDFRGTLVNNGTIIAQGGTGTGLAGC